MKTKRYKILLIIILAFASSVVADAQSEIIGGCANKSGTVYGINQESRFPMYSVMKFPQALFVADFLNRGNINLTDEVIIRKEDLIQDTWSPMLSTFEETRGFTYAELLALSLQQSDNNACDILFRLCGGPKAVEKYIRNIGIKDIRIRKTEKQMHARPTHSSKNWCTPHSMVALLEWFSAHHDDNEPLCYIWKLMRECQTGENRLPSAVPNAKVIHKTGTGYPISPDRPSGICDVGIILLEDGRQIPIAIFVTAPSSESVIAEVARQLLEMK